MSKKRDKSQGDDKPAKPTFTDTEIAKARRWFEKGQELAEKKNYDYAIESYISGLAFWPEAVEEGHKPCRAAALFRGPQKVSFTGGMKYKTKTYRVQEGKVVDLQLLVINESDRFSLSHGTGEASVPEWEVEMIGYRMPMILELLDAGGHELEYVETAIETKFQDHFVAALPLPHASDPFPHLKAFLPADRGRPKHAAARRARRGAVK